MRVFQKCHLGLGENRTQVLLHRSRVCYRVCHSTSSVINYFLYFQLKCSLWALAFTLIIAPILANNDSGIIETARNGKGKVFVPLFSLCLLVSQYFSLFFSLSVFVSFFLPLYLFPSLSLYLFSFSIFQMSTLLPF